MIDVLAILPYYVSLFLMEPETMPDPATFSLTTTTEKTTSTTPDILFEEEEEGGASFDDVRRIIQVRILKYIEAETSGSVLHPQTLGPFINYVDRIRIFAPTHFVDKFTT